MSFEKLPQEIVNHIALFVSDPATFSLLCKRTREPGQKALFRHVSLTESVENWQRLQFTSNTADYVRSAHIDTSHFECLTDPSSYMSQGTDLVALKRLSQSMVLLKHLSALKLGSYNLNVLPYLSLSNITYLSLEYVDWPGVIEIVNRATRLEHLEI